MDSNSFKLGTFVVVAVCLVVGTIGYFMNNQAVINRGADVTQAQIEFTAKVEKAKLVQEAKIERTKERWASLPFFREDKPEQVEE